MNRLLAEALSFLNGLIAIVIIIAGISIGYRVSSGTLFGVTVGGILGLVLASLSCGALAYLALIEQHLAEIAGRRQSTSGPVNNATFKKREPTM